MRFFQKVHIVTCLKEHMNLLVNRRLFPVPIVDRNTNVLFIALGQGQALSLHAQGEIHSKHHLDIVGATIVSPLHRSLFPVRSAEAA